MSQSIQAQADIGSLGLQGLGAFTTILATISADNVAPMAVIQMERLGAAFMVNGEHAERTKTLLQRSGDIRLDKLALVVGWRKNDTASLMGDSAGGQAISLVSVCLSSMFRFSEVGQVLRMLSSIFLPYSMNVASVSQLASVAEFLAVKMAPIGFGNIIAREVSKIHDTYNVMGRPAPTDLLECLETASVATLLETMSRAMREHDKICTVSGSRGMGYIITMLEILFPRSTVVTAEDTIIQELERPRIRCEILSRDDDHTTYVRLETIVMTSGQMNLPIATSEMKKYSGRGDGEEFDFKWSGCLAEWLRLAWLNYGLTCDQAVLDACCDYLMAIVPTLGILPTVKLDNKKAQSLRSTPIVELLGSLLRARMYKICTDMWSSRVGARTFDPDGGLANLVAAIEATTTRTTFECVPSSRCSRRSNWPSGIDGDSNSDCVL